MGSESSKSESNFSKSDSESSSNSGLDEGLETMNCHPHNSKTIIKRVWIIKKSIGIKDRHIMSTIKGFVPLYSFYFIPGLNKVINFYRVGENIKTKDWNSDFKHWAIILELSNNSYVNIQFGRNGFSLKEFKETVIEGQNIWEAILDTWGKKTAPISFCYLGNANFEYEKLKNILREIKEKEIKNFNENGCTFYNLIHRNCQHFSCDIEKILFNKIRTWHSFDYYLEDFFKTFFSKMNINELMKIIDDYSEKNKGKEI